MLIKRSLLDSINKTLAGEPKVILLYGPRQAGKTTLLQQVAQRHPSGLILNGDDIRTQEVLSVPNAHTLTTLVGNVKLLIIDEAQRIPGIGLSLKLLFDTLHIPIIASGSSSFDLAQKTSEPLTGRATLMTLYPLSVLEVPVHAPDTTVLPRLEEFLRFGLYPKTVTLESIEKKQQYLADLINTYMYKDILTFETVRKPKKVIDLLSLLALQIGNEVSISELAQQISLSKTIVEKYLDILEQMFVLINLRGFSRNLRKEISKTSKYYFTDLGLRNGLIRNFNPLHMRDDVGALWENFCIIERIKARVNRRKPANWYFWRTYDQKEIDLIEEEGGTLKAYEYKWSDRKPSRGAAAREFTATYPNSKVATVSPATLLPFLKT